MWKAPQQGGLPSCLHPPLSYLVLTLVCGEAFHMPCQLTRLEEQPGERGGWFSTSRLKGLVQRSHEYEGGILREMSFFLLIAVNHLLALKLDSRQTLQRMWGQLQCRKVLPSFFLQIQTAPGCGGTGQPAVSVLGIKRRRVSELARADTSALSCSIGITSPLLAGIRYYICQCVYLACSPSSASCESVPKPTQRIVVFLLRTLFSFSIN